MIKNLLLGSMIAAGLVALLAIADLAMGIPFSGYSMMMDLMFLISAGIVMYMGWDCYKDMI